MRRTNLLCGGLFLTLGFLSPAFLEQALKVNKVIASKGPEAFWHFQQEELRKYLPLATKMGIRK